MKMIFATVMVVGLAFGLAACNGGDGGGGSASGGGTTVNSPKPEQPSPSDPDARHTAVFGDWVHSQFKGNARDSSAAPTDVGKVDFKFKHNNDPTAFNDLLSGSSTAGGGG
jgi:predicted small secreted protein